MSLAYSLVGSSGSSNITVFVNGEIFTADESHPNWDKIVDGARAGDDDIAVLFDASVAAAEQFQRLSERATVLNSRVYFDGEEVHSVLTDQVVRLLNEGADFKPLINFWEKLASNPNEHSREQLYRWLATEEFTITEDGDILGYKGVQDNLRSVSSGPGIVNGIPTNGHLDNSVGNVLEMARGSVTHDPNRGCAEGLHVGSWQYASTFGSVTLKVLVNPRDVVSVPTDCADQKMRVCRYTVLEVADGKIDSAVAAVANHTEARSADTRENHKRQARDSHGRFLSKV